MCFPVNFAKFLRIPFFIKHLWQLLLYIGFSDATDDMIKSDMKDEYIKETNNCSLFDVIKNPGLFLKKNSEPKKIDCTLK